WSVSCSTTARILAALGAEVIKVEWPKSPDYMRFAFFAKGDKPTIDNGAFFNNLNAGKLGISLNAKSPQGMELVHELLSVSDIVLENFSTGVFEKWGLTYENLDRKRHVWTPVTFRPRMPSSAWNNAPSLSNYA